MNSLASTSATSTGQPACCFAFGHSAEETAALLNNRENYKTRSERALAQIAAAELRNLNGLASLQHGQVAIGTSRRVAHIWNLALQSPMFDRLWMSHFTEREVLAQRDASLQFPGLDQVLLDWMIEYLESTDDKREEMLKGFQPDRLFDLLLIADFFQLNTLKEVIELSIIQDFTFDKEALEGLSSLELCSFKTLQKFFFLVMWFQVKSPEGRVEDCCMQARKVILSNIKHIPQLTVQLSDLPFLMSLSPQKAPTIDFSLQAEWQPDEVSLQQLDIIGRDFKSKKLQMYVLGERLKLLGAHLEPVSARKLYVDGVHKDNYYPSQRIAPVPITERYLRQRNFFHHPCPSLSYEAVVHLTNLNDAVIELIQEYPQLKLGIEVSNEALLGREESIPRLNNVHLLACEGNLTADSLLKEKLRRIMGKMPNLDILVVNPESLNALTGLRFSSHRFHEKKISLWKTLSGKVVKQRVAIRNGFDAEWEKREDSYVDDLKRKMAAVPQQELSPEDQRVKELIGQIPFAKSDLPSPLPENRVRFPVKSSF